MPLRKLLRGVVALHAGEELLRVLLPAGATQRARRLLAVVHEALREACRGEGHPLLGVLLLAHEEERLLLVSQWECRPTELCFQSEPRQHDALAVLVGVKQPVWCGRAPELPNRRPELDGDLDERVGHLSERLHGLVADREEISSAIVHGRQASRHPQAGGLGVYEVDLAVKNVGLALLLWTLWSHCRARSSLRSALGSRAGTGQLGQGQSAPCGRQFLH
mmetsp:Transcript_67355/g.219410  ORF Transcript_67355/g.219410 Transcript_67355/m.219410 type:complete len:220 (-) Transcript_67355:326-985(-)